MASKTDVASEIHSSAVIHPSVKIPDGMEIGPYSVIGEGVTFEGPCVIHERVSISGDTTIGEGCSFFPGAVIGAIPQDSKFKGEVTKLTIGSNNSFRECVSVHLGTGSGGGLTSIGNNNMLMGYVHVAHDCHIRNNVILANYVGLSGHITIEDFAVFGGKVGIIQFATIGQYAHVGGHIALTKDVTPYSRVSESDKVKVIGINSVLMERQNMDKELQNKIKEAIHTISNRKLTVAEALSKIEENEMIPEIEHIVNFVRNSKLGVYR